MDDVRAMVLRATAAEGEPAERLAAFGKLVERFHDLCFGYAYATLVDFHLAEDAAQEAFIAAFAQLHRLREPEAFPAWLRRLVQTACGRMTRGRRISCTAIDAAAGIASPLPGPSEEVEASETRAQVETALRALPQSQREVLTLFYIGGYSQREVAEFLELPVTTVNNRLHAARSQLKERMIQMVRDTLQHHAPDERHSAQLIKELLARPKPLEIAGHPVREVWDAVRSALPDYEVLNTDEVVGRHAVGGFATDEEDAYQMDADRFLRTETSSVTMSALRGRTPPVRLLTAGRVFRAVAEDAGHLKVFNQADALCVEPGADGKALRETLARVLERVLGAAELRWTDESFRGFGAGLEVAARLGGRWSTVAGGAVLTREKLAAADLTGATLSGFAFGLGLERMAMLRTGVEDIRELWRPPYVPA